MFVKRMCEKWALRLVCKMQNPHSTHQLTQDPMKASKQNFEEVSFFLQKSNIMLRQDGVTAHPHPRTTLSTKTMIKVSKKWFPDKYQEQNRDWATRVTFTCHTLGAQLTRTVAWSLTVLGLGWGSWSSLWIGPSLQQSGDQDQSKGQPRY